MLSLLRLITWRQSHIESDWVWQFQYWPGRLFERRLCVKVPLEKKEKTAWQFFIPIYEAACKPTVAEGGEEIEYAEQLGVFFFNPLTVSPPENVSSKFPNYFSAVWLQQKQV